MAKDDTTGKGPASNLGKADNSSISAQELSGQEQSITICGLDGTQFELKLPTTATVLDLKVIEAQGGTPRTHKTFTAQIKKNH